MDKQNIVIIEKMMCKGIKSSMEMSEILEREYGLQIAPHIISEYLFRTRVGSIKQN